MDARVKQDLSLRGYAFEQLKGLAKRPRANYYIRDKNTGEVKTVNLPADAYSIQHYLSAGFVLNKEDLETDVSSKGLLASGVGVNQGVSPPFTLEYTCPVCLKTFPKTPRGQRQLAGCLSGHARAKKSLRKKA